MKEVVATSSAFSGVSEVESISNSRAYSSNGTNVVISDKYGNSYELDKTNSEYTISGSPVGAKHDCVQNKLTYMYHPFQSGIPGGDGRHISYILFLSAQCLSLN